MRFVPSLLKTSVALGCLIAAMPVAAQEAESDAADTPKSGVGDIVVTANKRAQNMQDVPISIAAFDGEMLKTQGIQSVVDLPQATPGLSFTRTLVGTNAFLRGVGTTTAGYSTEVPIATYVDGLYLPNSAASSFAFNNIERIEVLKGPQGTLYGRNSTGGLIHVITKEPGGTPEVDASISYANYDTVQANFYGSTPISDTLSANFAALYINQGKGWGRNVFLDTEAYKFKDIGFQGKLKWEPTPNTTITLRGFYDKTESDQGNSAYIYPGSTGADGSVFLGEYNNAYRIQPFAKQRQYSLSLKAEQDLGFATLTSITGYINNRSPSQSVQSGNLGTAIPGQGAINLSGRQSAKTWSQELQLASNSSEPLQWIVGGFFYDDDTVIQTDVYAYCVSNVCPPPPPSRTTGNQKTRSYAGFGEATYSFTPATRVTLGLRYTSDRKTLTGLVEPLVGRPNSIPGFPPGFVTQPGQPFAGFPGGIDTDVTFGKLTYKLVLAQDITPDVHAYVSYNRGFKSGGYNPISFTNPPSRPEVLDAFEVGLKSDLFDRMLRFNVAAFYYDYQDIQLRSTAPPAPPGGSVLFNAASAHIKGIDADFVLAPTDGLTINGGFVILDAKFNDFPGGTCTTPRIVGPGVVGGFTSAPCDLSGYRLPSAPKFSYSLGITYRFDTPIGEFELNATDGFKSRYYWEPDNRLDQDAYHLVNASVTWNVKDSGFSLQLFGRNLGGEYYFAGAAEGTGGNDVHLPGAPRTYGVKARYQF
jgi:iron complex outermembrane receptor protein